MTDTNNGELKPNQAATTTTEPPFIMDRVELIYLKAAIDSIPILTQENFSLWHTRVINYPDLQGLKEFFLDGKGKLEEVDKRMSESSSLPS